MAFSLRKRVASFTHAFRGAVTLIATQHNAWIHFVATLVVVIAGSVLSITRLEWLVVVISMTLVWMAEALNTALEFLADEVTLEKRDRIKKAKDVAAFGVLIAAVGALVVGAIVFLPYLG